MFADYYNSPEFQRAVAQYSAPMAAPAPVPAPAPVRTPAVAPMSVRAEPVVGIGSPVVTSSTVATAPVAGIGSPAATAAPYDVSKIDLSMLGGFGGGRMGGVRQNDPNQQYIDAPVSNKGNDTARQGMGANVFVMRDDQPVRLVDLSTNKIIFEGVGYDAAREATRLAQNITDTKGNKASYDIQTADPSGNYTTVANEKYNKSTMEVIESTALDIALPIIMNAIIPGSGLLSTMAGNALGAVASGVIQGKGIGDIATSALIAGAAGGITQGIGLDKAIGGALNDLGSNLAKEAVEEVGEEIVVTGLSQLAQAAGGAVANTIIKAGLSEVTEQAAEKATGDIVAIGSNVSDTLAGTVSGIGGSAANAVISEPTTTEPNKTAEEVIEEETGDIVALADEAASTTIPVPGIGNPLVNTVTNQPVTTEPTKTAEQAIEEETGEIVALADTATPVTVPVPGIGGIVNPISDGVIDRISDMENDQASDDIVVTGGETAFPISVPLDPGLSGIGSDILPPLTSDPALTDDDNIFDTIKDVTDVVGAVTPFIPLVTGGGGGGGTRPPDTTGITFTEGTLTPTIPVGGIGGAGGYPYTPQTYGRRGGDQETEYVFFTRNPVTGEAVVVDGPAGGQGAGQGGPPGKKEGGEIEDDMVKHLVDYHKNGGHHGPGQVKGIGSGQEDKIPAYLSDGEYVWSAQDVSDLGDGSNDEGVRRLNKMRQMVRRQAGRKDVKKIAKPQKGIDTMLKAVGGMA
jgi:hypothetical protein